jgi:hypothetical protein
MIAPRSHFVSRPTCDQRDGFRTRWRPVTRGMPADRLFGSDGGLALLTNVVNLVSDSARYPRMMVPGKPSSRVVVSVALPAVKSVPLRGEERQMAGLDNSQPLTNEFEHKGQTVPSDMHPAPVIRDQADSGSTKESNDGTNRQRLVDVAAAELASI